MVETRVLDLKTTADVEDFCRALLRLKRLGPASVSLTVALTVRRDVKVRGNKRFGDPVRSILDAVDPTPLPQTVLPPPPPEPQKVDQNPSKTASGRPTAPPPPRDKRSRRGIIGLK